MEHLINGSKLQRVLMVLAKIPIEQFSDFRSKKPDIPITAWNGHPLNVGDVLEARELLAEFGVPVEFNEAAREVRPLSIEERLSNCVKVVVMQCWHCDGELGSKPILFHDHLFCSEICKAPYVKQSL